MAEINRQWILARRPSGPVVEQDFELREQAFTRPELRKGEILVQSLLFRCTPAMRTMMKASSQFMPPMAVGETVRGSAAARVIDSAHADFPVGSIVSTMPGWQDYAVIDANQMPPSRKPDNVSLEDFEGVFGGNSITAYFGLLEVGAPRPGETVVVSGAAGSTGSMAAQIARIKQCRVIGIAGGGEKCRWLKDTCKLDEVIDYKSEDIESRIRELCPDGVNVYFDNVGGATLDAVIENMAPFGRIPLCGQISSYDEGDALAPGPKNMMRVVYWRLKLQGFLGFDYPDKMESAMADLAQLHQQGELVARMDIHDGLAELPRTFMRLFDISARYWSGTIFPTSNMTGVQRCNSVEMGVEKPAGLLEHCSALRAVRQDHVFRMGHAFKHMQLGLNAGIEQFAMSPRRIAQQHVAGARDQYGGRKTAEIAVKR